MSCSSEVLPPSIWWMASPPNTSRHPERASDPTSGMLLRRRCARCTSRWLVSRSRRFGPSCWTLRRDFQLQSRSCSAGRAEPRDRSARRRSRRLEREECPCLRQIARVSTFCEPVVHVMEHFALVGGSAETSQAQCGPQLPGPRPVGTGDRDRLPEVPLRLVDVGGGLGQKHVTRLPL